MNARISAVALGVVASLVGVPAAARTQGMDHRQHTPAPPAQSLPPPTPDPHAGHDMSKMEGMSGMAMGDDAYIPAAGSGTTRLPAADGAMHGLHLMSCQWMLILHGYAWAKYSDQGGPRGDKLGFVTSMAMAEASRNLVQGTRIRLQTMLSLDPLLGARGYPNLFATGETAGGVPLVDRQHLHDLFMELSARIDSGLGHGVSGFLYGGPVAEPALGTSAFLHRRSARLNWEAPITHHWFDSTPIT